MRLILAPATVVARLFASSRERAARIVVHTGLSPNVLTLLGLLLAVPVAWCWYLGQQSRGGWLLVIVSILDLLDGSVARVSGRVTRFGGYLDSVIDRYTDILLYAGALSYLLRHTTGQTQIVYLVVWVGAVAGAIMPSFARARAETLIPLCKVGYFERGERNVTLIIGSIAGNLHLALVITAVFGNLATLARILYTQEQLEPRQRSWDGLIWRWERLSPQHFGLSLALVLLLLFGHHLLPRP